MKLYAVSFYDSIGFETGAALVAAPEGSLSELNYHPDLMNLAESYELETMFTPMAIGSPDFEVEELRDYEDGDLIDYKLIDGRLILQ